jgi:5'-nucleotidase
LFFTFLEFEMKFLLTIFASLILFIPSTAQTTRVTILHVNDTYQFTPVDGGKRGGLARLMTLRKIAVEENPNVIFTLGGDTLSPSVETRTYRGAQMIDAWNKVGLDYSVLGNHEFDIKKEELLQRMKESNFTWLGANVVDSKTGKLFGDTPPYVIREFGTVKIGLVGFLLPETRETSSIDDSVEITDFCETAKKLVPEMRAKGATAIIGLTHLTMAQDKKLAGCAKFDLILGGHEHSLLQSSANGTPIFKMTADAREMGQFHMIFDSVSGVLESIDWEILPVTDAIPDDPDFAPVFEKYRDLLEKLEEVVGSTSVPLDSYSQSVRTKETEIANFIADAYRNAVGADIGFVNGGSIRADLAYNPGPLTKRTVLSMLPFNNAIVKVEISGKVLKEVLEHGVARSGVGEDVEPGRFPQVAGISFKYDTKLPAGGRVVELLVGGKPYDPKTIYTMATSDFLVSRGGDGYTMLQSLKIVVDADVAPKDSAAFEEAIRNSPNSTISPKVENRIVRIN